jgi:DNA-binding transcriptional LysR family regulator
MEIMKIQDFRQWEAFLQVARSGGFSLAAKQMNCTTSLVSKCIARLEQNLGVKLFYRSTRVVTLTHDGQALLPRVRGILDDLTALETSVSQTDQLTGLIKLSCVPFLAQHLLLPVLQEFSNLHPKVHFDIEISKSFVNLIEDGYDLAIRIETPKDSSLIYKRLAPNHLIFCASPKYLESRAQPIATPEDLQHHDLLMLNIHRRVKFRNFQRSLAHYKSRQVIACNSGIYLTELCRSGMGVLVRSPLAIQEDFATGRLVRILKDFPLTTFGHIHAVIPSNKLLAPRVRVFLDCLVKQSLESTGLEIQD